VEEAPAIGSRWYAFGQHYEVKGYGERDGDPAVRIQNVNRPKDRATVAIWRLLRKGERTG
jgi:hypothetical protein